MYSKLVLYRITVVYIPNKTMSTINYIYTILKIAPRQLILVHKELGRGEFKLMADVFVMMTHMQDKMKCLVSLLAKSITPTYRADDIAGHIIEYTHYTSQLCKFMILQC